MKNEIDRTVERIGQLPNHRHLVACDGPPECDLSSGEDVLSTDSVISLALAYTKLKADLATAVNEADALRSMLADALVVIERSRGITESRADYDDLCTVINRINAAIKPNAAAGETSDALEQGGDAL